MADFINTLTTIPVVFFFSIWFISFSLLLFSIIGAVDADLGLSIEEPEFNNRVLDFFIGKSINKVPLIISIFLASSVGLLISISLIDILNKFSINFFDKSFIANVVGSIIFFPISIISMYITLPFLKFLEPLFENGENKKKIDFIGMECIVNTYNVNKEFGEIKVLIKNNEYILNAISEEELFKGDKALIIDKEENSNNYIIQKIQ